MTQLAARRVDLGCCVVEIVGTHVLTTWEDGSKTANWPPDDHGQFAAIAATCGFGPDDLLAYVFEHELCHALVPLRLFGERGYVSWMAAQGRRMSLAAAKAEERLIYYVQRFIADPAYPCPDPQWAQIRDEVLALRRDVLCST